jgi:hypothetical protein
MRTSNVLSLSLPGGMLRWPANLARSEDPIVSELVREPWTHRRNPGVGFAGVGSAINRRAARTKTVR